jgi:hypothetical protein
VGSPTDRLGDPIGRHETTALDDGSSGIIHTAAKRCGSPLIHASPARGETYPVSAAFVGEWQVSRRRVLFDTATPPAFRLIRVATPRGTGRINIQRG